MVLPLLLVGGEDGTEPPPEFEEFGTVPSPG